MRRHQDGEIDDAVLLGADELLAIEDEDRLRAFVAHTQLRDASLLGDLGDLRPAIAEALIEGEVERLTLGVGRAQQRQHRDGGMSDRKAEGHGGERMADHIFHTLMMPSDPGQGGSRSLRCQGASRRCLGAKVPGALGAKVPGAWVLGARCSLQWIVKPSPIWPTLASTFELLIAKPFQNGVRLTFFP